MTGQARDAASLPRSAVQERLDAAVLTVLRIRSEELDDNDALDLDLLPYYEGRRDALRELLEPGFGDV